MIICLSVPQMDPTTEVNPEFPVGGGGWVGTMPQFAKCSEQPMKNNPYKKLLNGVFGRPAQGTAWIRRWNNLVGRGKEDTMQSKQLKNTPCWQINKTVQRKEGCRSIMIHKCSHVWIGSSMCPYRSVVQSGAQQLSVSTDHQTGRVQTQCDYCDCVCEQLR